jgi:hypothetical protein
VADGSEVRLIAPEVDGRIRQIKEVKRRDEREDDSEYWS